MKKRLNQLNRILILFLVTAICLTSCEKENLTEQDNTEQIDFKVQTLSFKELQSLNQKASKFIKDFNNKSINESLGARTTELYGKTVDTVSINYLEKDDGYSSTTLKVKNDSIGLNHFENLLIEDYPDGTQSVKLVKYNLTKPIELIDSDEELNSSITSSDVSLYSSQTSSFSRQECIEVGYYKEVDKCEGQLVTPEGEPWCFNEDGTRATRTVFVTIDEDCTWTSGGGGTGDGGDQNGGNDGENNTGGSYTGAGIFVPNIYSGEEDPTNPDFILAGEVGIFFNNLPQNLQNLTNGNTWIYAYTVDYFRNSRGGVNQENSQHVEDALSNFEFFKDNYYKTNRSIANNERLNFWAFYNLLHTGGPSNITDNTQDIFDIGNFLMGVDSNTDYLTITRLFENFDSNEEFEYYYSLIEIFINDMNIDRNLIADWFLNSPDFIEPDLGINPEDITYDEQLTQQDLPSLNDFVDNFPKLGTTGNYTEMPTSQVYQLVGGSLLTSHQNNPSAYSNACSIRGSRGLLYSGIDIPVLNYPGVGQRTQKGGDNENYILDAVSFDKFMRDKFGDATYELTGSDANDPVQVANLLNDKNGIYVIINSSHSQAGYSGHVDAIIDGDCVSNAYTTPNGGVASIRIWELN